MVPGFGFGVACMRVFLYRLLSLLAFCGRLDAAYSSGKAVDVGFSRGKAVEYYFECAARGGFVFCVSVVWYLVCVGCPSRFALLELRVRASTASLCVIFFRPDGKGLDMCCCYSTCVTCVEREIRNDFVGKALAEEQTKRQPLEQQQSMYTKGGDSYGTFAVETLFVLPHHASRYDFHDCMAIGRRFWRGLTG